MVGKRMTFFCGNGFICITAVENGWLLACGLYFSHFLIGKAKAFLDNIQGDPVIHKASGVFNPFF